MKSINELPDFEELGYRLIAVGPHTFDKDGVRYRDYGFYNDAEQNAVLCWMPEDYMKGRYELEVTD